MLQLPLFQRRQGLAWLLAWLAGGAHAQTAGTPSAVAQALTARRLASDGIGIEFPRLADTGNAVPLRLDMQAPAGLLITAVEVILPENPNTTVLTLRLVEPQPRFLFNTRLRLAASQDVWALMRLSDGSERAASAPTIITSSACFDGS